MTVRNTVKLERREMNFLCLKKAGGRICSHITPSERFIVQLVNRKTSATREEAVWCGMGHGTGAGVI